jgi:hypothetical protein
MEVFVRRATTVSKVLKHLPNTHVITALITLFGDERVLQTVWVAHLVKCATEEASKRRLETAVQDSTARVDVQRQCPQMK